jgi:hypothetical protein
MHEEAVNDNQSIDGDNSVEKTATTYPIRKSQIVPCKGGEVDPGHVSSTHVKQLALSK